MQQKTYIMPYNYFAKSQVDMFIILIGIIDQQQAFAEYSC